MTDSREIDRNYEYFGTVVDGLMETNAGQYALLHDRQIVGFHTSLADAVQTGYTEYPDGMFSIQEVNNVPICLGIYSMA